MRIRGLTAFELPIMLKKPVRHALHERRQNDTLIVRCELSDGSIGWGEGLPRTYVTGESIESVWRHLMATDFAQLADRELDSPASAVAMMDEFRLASVAADAGIAVRECFGNTVRCAVELSVLDAVCQSVGCSLSEVIACVPEVRPLMKPQQQVQYSGVITSTGTLGQWRAAIRMKVFGFRQIKVKVGTFDTNDVACLRRVRRIVGSGVDLRLDANEAWNADELIHRVRPLLMSGPTCLEQPVSHAILGCLTDLRSHLNVPIMLDESLCCLQDAARAIQNRWCDGFNLRLSKCGGFVASLRLAALAAKHGLFFQLGCQVGETGILSAAGRHFACNIAPIRYLEGCYGRFLVREQLTHEDLTFGYGGRVPRLSGNGLGITVDQRKVLDISKRTENLL